MKKSLLISLVFVCFGSVTSLFGQCTTITQPDNALLCPAVGSMTTVSVATDAPSATYTWQYRVVKPTNLNPAWITITAANAGAVYSNYTTASLGVTRANSILPVVGTQYRVLVGGGSCGPITSNSANLVLLDPVKAGTIVSAPSVCTGMDMTLQVSGYVGTSLQWLSSTTSTGVYTPIAGETTDMYTLTSANASSPRYYKVLVTNDACATVAATPIKIVKIDPLTVGGTVLGGGTMCFDSQMTLQLVGSKGTIQWESSKDGVEFDKVPTALENSPSFTYETTSVSGSLATYVVGHLTAPTYFRAKVTSGFCSKAYSNVVSCLLGDTASAQGISAASSSVCKGTGTTLTVVANGAITWEKSTNYTTANPTWTVTTNHTNTFTTGNLAVSTAYRVRVSVGSCSELSTIYTDVAEVAVLPSALAKTATPNVTVPSGKTAAAALCTSDVSKVLTLGAGYVGNVQWQVSTTSSTSGYTDLAGATAGVYAVEAPSVGVNYFRAKFTNACGLSVYNTPVAVYYTDCGTGKVATPALQPLKVVVYPNPYATSFALDIQRSSGDALGIVVHDVMGREIERQTVVPSDLTVASFGATYPAGIYMITVTQGDARQTVRVVKR